MKHRHTCQYCKKKRYEEHMVMINSKSEKNGKPEWACMECAEIQMFTNKGCHFIKCTGAIIQKVSVDWGDSIVNPGQYFTEIGNGKKRTTLKIDGTYVGMLIHKGIPFMLFTTNLPSYYLSPIYIDNESLLMPSSPNTFWDIRAYESKQQKN